VEKTAAYANVGFTDVFNTVDDRCTDCAGDTIVIRFADTTYCRDIRFDKVMLRQIYS